MNFKTKFFLPALLAGSAVFGAVEAKPLSDAELFNATVKNVDMGGKELKYNNLHGLKDVLGQFISVVTASLASYPDFARNPQAQLGLMALTQFLDISGIDSVQAYAQSVKATGNGNGRVRTFMYTGANPQGLYFDLASRQNRSFAMLKNIPCSADGMVAMGCFIDFNAAWKGLKKNVVPGSQAGALPIMLEMQYEQTTGQKLSTLLRSISGEYQVIARAYMEKNGTDISGDIYISIPDSSGALTALLQKHLKAGKNGVMLFPRTPDMPDFVAPRIEFAPGRIIVASSSITANACKDNSCKFDSAPLLKAMPQGKGTGYIAVSVPQKSLDMITAAFPQMANLVKKSGGIQINAVSFVTPEGYGSTADMNFVPDSLSAAGTVMGLQLNLLQPALEKIQTQKD